MSKDLELKPIDKSKSSFELLKDVERTINTMEEMDSLLINSYVDYCIDSILVQETNVKKKCELVSFMCIDRFQKHFSLKQKTHLVDEILKGRYYDPCVSEIGFEDTATEEPIDTPILSFLLKNESDKIRNSIRTAQKELSKKECDGCDAGSHDVFYWRVLLYMHDNATIDSLFHTLLTASKAKEKKDVGDILTFCPLSMEWFKYRKPDLFDVMCDILHANKNAYLVYKLCSYDEGCFTRYESLDFYLMRAIKSSIVDFPKWKENELEIIEDEKEVHKNLSEAYKKRVIGWMKKHRSNYAFIEE